MALYGQFASSAVALVAVALTVLAILFALPDRERLKTLREEPAWPRLQALLMAAAVLCFVTLVTAHVGSAVDRKMPGIEWLEQILLASSVMAVLALLVAGVTFALVLSIVAEDPDSPTSGQGGRP